MLKELFARFTSAPKTLPQATETLTEAKATLDSVAALFTAAGLNLEQMLAAGPDALKAHLDSLDNTEELTEALQENEKLTADLETANTRAENANLQATHLSGLLAVIGFDAKSQATVQPSEIKTAFESHVAKQTTLALAKTGHPPAHLPSSAEATEGKPATDAELLAEYEKMPVGTARLDFYSKHEAALLRAHRAR